MALSDDTWPYPDEDKKHFERRVIWKAIWTTLLGVVLLPISWFYWDFAPESSWISWPIFVLFMPIFCWFWWFVMGNALDQARRGGKQPERRSRTEIFGRTFETKNAPPF